MDTFNRIFDQYARQLLGFVYKYCGDSDVSADIVQESFTRLWEKRSKIQSENNYKKYLFTIALNLSYDQNNKKARNNEISLTSLQENGFTILDKRIDVIDDLALREIAEFTQKRIDSLPDKDRAVFIMKQYNNLSYQEIGEIIGESSRNIKRRIRKTLDTLLAEFDKKGIKKEGIKLWLLL